MPGILMDALVRVSADLSCISETKSPPRLKPLVEQVAHQSLAKLDLYRLVEPRLRHVQNQEPTGNEAENHELFEEVPQILAGERIVKGTIPCVEHDLPVRRGADNRHQGGYKKHDLVPLRRSPEGAKHHFQLRHKTVGGHRAARDRRHLGWLAGSICHETGFQLFVPISVIFVKQSGLVHRLAYSGDVVAFKMGRRQDARRAHI